MFKIILATLTLLTTLTTQAGINPRGLTLDQWLDHSKPISFQNLLANISPAGTAPGTVVASPSQNQPDYWYHWVRDAALVMQIVVDAYRDAKTPEERGRYLRMILDYMDISRKNQQTPNLIGGIGEPKFEVDGSGFFGDWGRPQDDGPALRAITLMRFASLLIAEGKEKFVEDKLYAFGDGHVPTLIKTDLEYVSHHWKNTSVDLWEEVRGHHFYTRMVQRRALLEGAKFAKLMGDFEAGGWYELQGKALEPEINRHWDANRKYIQSTLDRDGGLDYKYSNLDSSVILGVLHGATDDGFFPVTDPRVQATAFELKRVFGKIYPINKVGPKGVGIGRYPEDRYDGYQTGSLGNPWILLTNGLAEYHYVLAREVQKEQRLDRSSINKNFIDDLKLSSRSISRVVTRLKEAGDEYFSRTQFHSDSEGQFSEQMNRDHGFMQGARHLTWSYASFLTALAARP